MVHQCLPSPLFLSISNLHLNQVSQSSLVPLHLVTNRVFSRGRLNHTQIWTIGGKTDPAPYLPSYLKTKTNTQLQLTGNTHTCAFHLTDFLKGTSIISSQVSLGHRNKNTKLSPLRHPWEGDINSIRLFKELRAPFDALAAISFSYILSTYYSCILSSNKLTVIQKF